MDDANPHNCDLLLDRLGLPRELAEQAEPDAGGEGDVHPMKTMYAISSGEYSDYSVIAVCDSEETAKRWADAMNMDGNRYSGVRIETFPLLTAKTPVKQYATFYLSAELIDSGEVKQREWSVVDWPVGYRGLPPSRPQVRYVRAPCHHNKGGRLEITSATPELCRKVAQDRIAMWRAGAWGGPGHAEINEEA